MALTTIHSHQRGSLNNSLPESKAVTIIDDYAHHPTEINATLTAARQAWQDRRIIGVFQPHRFTRLRDHWEEFANCFEHVDQVVVCPVYTAGEKPIEGFDAAKIAEKIGAKATLATSLDHAHSFIANQLIEDDIVITLGAGNVNNVCTTLGELIDG